MNNWRSNESKICVSPKIPKSPALEYTSPKINKISVEISSDEPDFVPNYSSSDFAADLFANMPKGSMHLAHGTSEVIDCGFSLEIPAGYKICVSSCVSNVFLNLIESKKRIKVSIINFGEELILQHKQKIGMIWIEPVYFFEWILKG